MVWSTTSPTGSPEGVESLSRTGIETESAARTVASSSTTSGAFSAPRSAGRWLTVTDPSASAAPLLIV